MIREGVYARAYARALLGTAQARHEVERVTQDMLALDQQWRGSPELRSFCHSHQHGVPSQRSRVIAQIWGSTFSMTSILLLERLAAWGLLHLLPLTIACFHELSDRAAGCHNVKAVFACEPQEAELAHVRKMVTDAYGPIFRLDVQVDPALLAGACFRIDDRLVDASLAGRLARLKLGLLKPMPLETAAKGES